MQVRYALRRLAVEGRRSRRLYREQSPITYARNIKTPTLIMSTTAMRGCRSRSRTSLYRALKDNDVPVTFIAYPMGGHFPGDPVRQKDVYRRWADWVDEQMR